jgi:hypothetical protein
MCIVYNRSHQQLNIVTNEQLTSNDLIRNLKE